MYFIGIDNRVDGTRTVVLNLETASLAAQSEEHYGLVGGLPEGYCEQDPGLWVHAVDRTVRHCLMQLGEGRKRVAGIGVSGQSQGMVVLDGENCVVRPAKVAADRSAVGQCVELSQAFGGAPGLIELTGNPLRPTTLASRLCWLKQTEPYHFQRAASCLSPHDFLNYWLGGVKRSEFGEASETGLLDIRLRRWCRDLCEFIDPKLRELLPAVRSSCEPLGVLRPELARDWELPGEVLLSAGGAEEMMTALGAGAATTGSVSLSTDGAATISGVSEQPVIDPHGEVAAYCDATDRWMPLAKFVVPATRLENLQRHYGWNDQQWAEALAAGQPGAGGLLFLPGPSGSGNGSLRGMEGALLGVDGDHFTPVHVVRAAQEALAMEFGGSLLRMKELGFAPSDVRLSGRLAAHPGWRQLVADVLGLPVLAAKPESCSALGAALQAAVTFFHQSGEDLTYAEMTSYAVFSEKQSHCEPNLRLHGFYQELLAHREALGTALREGAY